MKTSALGSMTHSSLLVRCQCDVYLELTQPTVTSQSKHLLLIEIIFNNNGSLMKFQKQSNPNSGRAIAFICLEVISILEQPALDGSNSSDTKMIPSKL